jgi:hypothetical protein
MALVHLSPVKSQVRHACRTRPRRIVSLVFPLSPMGIWLKRQSYASYAL